MLHLSRNDLVALFLARHALEPLRGTRLERMLADSFSKIAEACPGEVSIQWHELDGAYSVKASGVLTADVTLFGDLLDAVTAGREVDFEYHKLTGFALKRQSTNSWNMRSIRTLTSELECPITACATAIVICVSSVNMAGLGGS
jgi:hypothetical protein